MKYIFVLLLGIATSAGANPGDSCSSDYSCGGGEKCLKQQYQMNGTCAKSVNEFGTPTYSMPSTDSVGPKMNDTDMCSFDTDCSIGFHCKKSLGQIKGYCMR